MISRGMKFRFAILALAFFAFGCASAPTASRIDYKPEKDARRSVALLYDPTPFKRELVDGVAKMLRAQGVSVVTDDLRFAEMHPPGNYDLVVLAATVQFMRAGSKAVRYLKGHKKAKNILLVSTSGRGNLSGVETYSGKFEPPDCLTGASEQDSMAALAERIAKRIMQRLEE